MTIINISCIQSIVCLAPDKQYGKFFQDGTEDNHWYMSEKTETITSCWAR
jgi:hypothetical protein